MSNLWRALAAAGVALFASCDVGQGDGTKLAPDFELIAYQGQEVLGGERVRLSDVLAATNRPVVLNFWAAQCPPCRTELPELQRVQRTFGDRLLVLGVDMGAFTNLGTADEARRLLGELKIEYPIGTISDESVVRRYRILGLPVTYFLKPGGEIHRTWTGGLDGNELDKRVAELLTAAATS